MRGKEFLDTTPTVALNDVQMAHLWITQEPPKEYSDFGEVSLHFTLPRSPYFREITGFFLSKNARPWLFWDLTRHMLVGG